MQRYKNKKTGVILTPKTKLAEEQLKKRFALHAVQSKR